MTSGSKTRRIEPVFLPKIWGSPRVAPWFEPQSGQCPAEPPGDPIGEVWFSSRDLLIKFLFTSAALSVQVHPDDGYARLNHNSTGKTEMWHILRADPGARVALGFKQPVTPDRMMSAAKSGEIMDLLNWIEVHPGDTYFVPAGTVHAIGAGLALCEVQQNSDITYRLFDYGRNRELHLREAKDVARTGVHPGQCFPRDMGNGVELLVECPYFRTYRTVAKQPVRFAPRFETRFLVVLEGSGRVNGLTASPGHVFEAPESHEWFIEPGSGSMNLLLIA
jgi:mannose-6-phosphate isomerase